MHLLDQPLLVEKLKIAPDGHVGHGQLGDQIRDPDAAIRPDPIEDVRLSLSSQHDPGLLTCDCSPTPVSHKIAHKKTEFIRGRSRIRAETCLTRGSGRSTIAATMSVSV